ncbi:MAG: hypothetical protein ABSA29_07975 [Terriglobales bacterium]
MRPAQITRAPFFYILPYNCLALSVAVWAYSFQSGKLRIVVLAEHI